MVSLFLLDAHLRRHHTLKVARLCSSTQSNVSMTKLDPFCWRRPVVALKTPVKQKFSQTIATRPCCRESRVLFKVRNTVSSVRRSAVRSFSLISRHPLNHGHSHFLQAPSRHSSAPGSGPVFPKRTSSIINETRQPSCSSQKPSHQQCKHSLARASTSSSQKTCRQWV